MDKYKKMVESNKVASTEKINLAIQAMQIMYSENVVITIGELVKKTGLSRSFFYNNEDVVKALEEYKKRQDGKAHTRKQKVVLDKAMEKQISLMQMKIDELEEEKADLQKQVERLKKALTKNDLKFVKNL